MTCDDALLALLVRRDAGPAAAHVEGCARCRADVPAVQAVAAAFDAMPAPAPGAGTLAPRIRRAAAPLLAANARRLPAAAWPRLAAALAAALLPLPVIMLVGWRTLVAVDALLSTVLPAPLSLYLVAIHATLLALLFALTYGGLPLVAAHQLRLQHEESHA